MARAVKPSWSGQAMGLLVQPVTESSLGPWLRPGIGLSKIVARLVAVALTRALGAGQQRNRGAATACGLCWPRGTCAVGALDRVMGDPKWCVAGARAFRLLAVAERWLLLPGMGAGQHGWLETRRRPAGVQGAATNGRMLLGRAYSRAGTTLALCWCALSDLCLFVGLCGDWPGRRGALISH